MIQGRFKSVEDFEPDDKRRLYPRFSQEHFQSNLKVSFSAFRDQVHATFISREIQIVEKLEAIASKKSITPAQLALAWVAAQGSDIIPIPGTKSIARLEENWASRDVQFTAQELQEIREVVDGFVASGSRYPETAQEVVEV